MKVEIICPSCGEKAYIKNKIILNSIRRKHKTYCSKKCADKGVKEHNSDEYTLFRDMLSKIKYNAKKKNILVNITLNDLKFLWENCKGTCQLSGQKLLIADTRYKKSHGFSTASVDRKDNTKGYIPGNIWFVHKDINDMKGTLQVDEFIRWCERVAAFANGVELPLTQDDLAV